MAVVSSRAEEIIAELRADILQGRYRPGERLPSERDLASRFEVNRGSVREAIKKLEQLGIVSVNPGGVRVKPVEEANLAILGHLLELGEIQKPTLIAQMMDVMGSIMALSARSAAMAADDDELSGLVETIGRLQDSLGDDEQHHENWRVLGEQFMALHRNLVLKLIGNGLRPQFLSALTELDVRPDIDPEAIRNELERLKEAVAMRDSKNISDAMIRHFQIIRDGLLKSVATEKTSATDSGAAFSDTTFSATTGSAAQ